MTARHKTDDAHETKAAGARPDGLVEQYGRVGPADIVAALECKKRREKAAARQRLYLSHDEAQVE